MRVWVFSRSAGARARRGGVYEHDSDYVSVQVYDHVHDHDHVVAV